MIDLHRGVRWSVPAAVLAAVLLAAGCSGSSTDGKPADSAAGSHTTAGPSGSHESSSDGGSDGDGGSSDGLHVKVLKTGVAPLVAGTTSSEIAVYAQLKNTGSTAGALVSWTGYGADGAKLPSDTDDVGPQTSGLTLPAGKTVYAVLANPFQGTTPKRVSVHVQAEDEPTSDDELTVSPLRVTSDVGGFKTAEVTAKHPAMDAGGGDSWGAFSSLDLICTSASGTVTGLGFVHPAVDAGESSPTYAKPLAFRGQVVGTADVSPQRCMVSPYEWDADQGLN